MICKDFLEMGRAERVREAEAGTEIQQEGRQQNMEKMNLAILGTGVIASKMAKTVCGMDDVVLYAAGSRDMERAERFARTYGAARAYGSYEEMLEDDGIDLVYVAAPHSHHFQYAKQCIAHGRPVLCEKAFTRNAREAEELIRCAREAGVFLAEAMWTRYTPMAQMLRGLLDSGKIGRVTGLSANIGAPAMHVERMVRPELAGGALLDVGIYLLNFATWVLGDEAERIFSAASLLENGVDRQEIINLFYPGGVMAALYSSMESSTDNRGVIFGTKGHIVVENLYNHERIRIYDCDLRPTETVVCPPQISGYEFELRSCKKALAGGRLECEEMPLAHTLRVMRMVDEITAQWAGAVGA